MLYSHFPTDYHPAFDPRGHLFPDVVLASVIFSWPVEKAFALVRGGHNISADAFAHTAHASGREATRASTWGTTKLCPAPERPIATASPTRSQSSSDVVTTTMTPATAEAFGQEREDARDDAIDIVEAAKRITWDSKRKKRRFAAGADGCGGGVGGGEGNCGRETGAKKGSNIGNSVGMARRGRLAVQRATSRLLAEEFGRSRRRFGGSRGLHVEEEATLAYDVKTLACYHRIRDHLERELGRIATDKEWAAGLGISEAELVRQVRGGGTG